MTRLVVGVLYLWLAGATVSGAHARDLIIVRSDGVRVHFEVEVAATASARSQGLMGRTQLPPRGGMWFDFGASMPVRMWMKDTPLPLDMLFVDAGGSVVAVHERARPYALDLIGAPVPVRYVLELMGGEAAALGLARGDRVLLSDDAHPREADKAAKASAKPSSDSGTLIGRRSPS